LTTPRGVTSAYQETEVLSSSSARLVPLLYERLLVSLKRAGMFMRKGDIEGKFDRLTLAQDIITELLSSLDLEAGGEVAERLAILYAFWSREISEASVRLEADRLDRIAEMVASLHESWEAAARAVEAGDTSGLQSAQS